MARAVLLVEKIGILDRILQCNVFPINQSPRATSNTHTNLLQLLQSINYFFARIHETREHGGSMDFVLEPIEIYLIVERLHQASHSVLGGNV